MPFAQLRALVVALVDEPGRGGTEHGDDDDPLDGLEAQPTTLRPGRSLRASTLDELIDALARG